MMICNEPLAKTDESLAKMDESLATMHIKTNALHYATPQHREEEKAKPTWEEWNYVDW